jgi:lipoate-protein ligase A
VISQIFQQAFHECGLKAQVKSAQDAFSNICFERTAQLELTFNGNKIMGAAQLRKKGFFMLQGVIPLKVDAGLYKRVFGSSSPHPAGISDMMSHFQVSHFVSSALSLFRKNMGSNYY